MSLQSDRLSALIEFCEQSARLRGKPASSVESHAGFALQEKELSGAPGIRLNSGDAENADELWLSVDRLHETKPPEVESEWLKPWLIVSRRPSEEPTLRNGVDGSALIDAGTHKGYGDASDLELVGAQDLVLLDEYQHKERVRALHAEYVAKKWSAWAAEEKERLRTIKLYAQLFTLKQQLEGGIVEAPIELVWGVGIGIWKTASAAVSYPLISQLVELSLNPISSALEVRPRNVNPRMELDWYAAKDNHGVSDLEKIAKKFFEEQSVSLSPFDRGSFEPLLRNAVTHLDANGVYWPTQTTPEDRSLPKGEEHLKVTDTWVLYSRPRTNSAYLQDLARLKAASDGIEEFPPAVAALVTDPDSSNPEIELPEFRGVSVTYQGDMGRSGQTPRTVEARDLYFPKPFNDEQVRIIQLLERFDGVVAQGPPGTGKTHTIANVICHFLANGKRVLVTSMKDPALGVLCEQLPEELRPLAISLLTSEQEGLKKFEHSILKIASEVQSLDRSATSREIRHIEESINNLHAKLAQIDWEISVWAKKNLTKISIDDQEIDAGDAAQELVANEGSFEWLPDTIGIESIYTPKFDDQEIIRLRALRSELGDDLVYLGASLPQLVEFPDAEVILRLHQDLSRLAEIRRELDQGNVPQLADNSPRTIEEALDLRIRLEELLKARSDISSSGEPWLQVAIKRLDAPEKVGVRPLLIQLGEALGSCRDRRNDFLNVPVTVPGPVEGNADLLAAISNLAEGKMRFGISGFFGKGEEKKFLDGIRVLGAPPSGKSEWAHVLQFVTLQNEFRQLAIRWNAIAPEFSLPEISESAQGGSRAVEIYSLLEKALSTKVIERDVLARTRALFPAWQKKDFLIEDPESLILLGVALHHHIIKNRLENVWAQKERVLKVLDGRSGPVVEKIWEFFESKLGNDEMSEVAVQGRWSELMAELSRVLGLSGKLDFVNEVCGKISQSGAPIFASTLRDPPKNPSIDHALPANWRLGWKLRRLDTYLKGIDAQRDLRRLSLSRREAEADLARAYQSVVVKRTWLKLAENASPSIRSALQAYLSAIQKIGKGTGKRAVRYRQDARNAASLANSAVPCWIMPHYRISESLPAELGCFDLVIIDEASQSDLTALPALLRARKVLIVGDDKQVSPEGVGLEEEKIRHLMTRFLGQQVETYRPQMSPERSIYDLFKVVYASSSVMLKEHFRCVGPIIEYSKREFYNHELKPLRLPRASERLDPPLIDVHVQDGFREGDKNSAEARYVVEEIKRIVVDEASKDRSIGVVSLLGDKQAYLIWEMLTDELGTEYLERHKIACGDARTFQGKERDIMFLSLVVAPNEGKIASLSRDTYAQRFNVAASRARDRMYLVRSVLPEHLSEADKLRRGLISHFTSPYVQDEVRVEDMRKLCESPFEREVYDALTERGYWVTPQVKVGQYRIDMVVEGLNDARLAVECDGDRYHGPDKWAEDMHRQRILERAGWVFWRCFASGWIRRKREMLDDLVQSLADLGIEPVGSAMTPKSLYTEHRAVRSSDMVPVDLEAGAAYLEPSGKMFDENALERPSTALGDEQASGGQHSESEIRSVNTSFDDTRLAEIEIRQVAREPYEKASPPPTLDFLPSGSRAYGFPFMEYKAFRGAVAGDPRDVSLEELSAGLLKIVTEEGPVLAKRAFDIYLRSVGVKRMGHEIRATMMEALEKCVKNSDIVAEFENGDKELIASIIRPFGASPLLVRTRGDRSFEEIPPSEIQYVARSLAQRSDLVAGSESQARATLEFYGLKRLTTQVAETLSGILRQRYSYVDEALAAQSSSNS